MIRNYRYNYPDCWYDEVVVVLEGEEEEEK
jgi:hypothetical protein